MTALRELTTDHLGQLATEEDLAAFKATVERIRPAFESETEAIDWLYGDGDYMPRMDANICIYCGLLGLHGSEVPAVDDDEAWARLGAEHESYCEWLDTRAHQKA